jgi:predicted enzyme related to lactoylglutathione lyase
MRLRIELFPADLDATIAFYSTALGFAVERREPGYATLERDGTRIGAAERPPVTDDGARRPPTGVEIVLEVADLAAERERVRRSGWPVAEDVTQRPWGLTDFRVLDPDGYYLRITTA